MRAHPRGWPGLDRGASGVGGSATRRRWTPRAGWDGMPGQGHGRGTGPVPQPTVVPGGGRVRSGARAPGRPTGTAQAARRGAGPRRAPRMVGAGPAPPGPTGRFDAYRRRAGPLRRRLRRKGCPGRRGTGAKGPAPAVGCQSLVPQRRSSARPRGRHPEHTSTPLGQAPSAAGHPAWWAPRWPRRARRPGAGPSRGGRAPLAGGGSAPGSARGTPPGLRRDRP